MWLYFLAITTGSDTRFLSGAQRKATINAALESFLIAGRQMICGHDVIDDFYARLPSPAPQRSSRL